MGTPLWPCPLWGVLHVLFLLLSTPRLCCSADQQLLPGWPGLTDMPPQCTCKLRASGGGCQSLPSVPVVQVRYGAAGSVWLIADLCSVQPVRVDSYLGSSNASCYVSSARTQAITLPLWCNAGSLLPPPNVTRIVRSVTPVPRLSAEQNSTNVSTPLPPLAPSPLAKTNDSSPSALSDSSGNIGATNRSTASNASSSLPSPLLNATATCYFSRLLRNFDPLKALSCALPPGTWASRTSGAVEEQVPPQESLISLRTSFSISLSAGNKSSVSYIYPLLVVLQLTVGTSGATGSLALLTDVSVGSPALVVASDVGPELEFQMSTTATPGALQVMRSDLSPMPGATAVPSNGTSSMQAWTVRVPFNQVCKTATCATKNISSTDTVMSTDLFVALCGANLPCASQPISVTLTSRSLFVAVASSDGLVLSAYDALRIPLNFLRRGRGPIVLVLSYAGRTQAFNYWNLTSLLLCSTASCDSQPVSELVADNITDPAVAGEMQRALWGTWSFAVEVTVPESAIEPYFATGYAVFVSARMELATVNGSAEVTVTDAIPLAVHRTAAISTSTPVLHAAQEYEDEDQRKNVALWLAIGLLVAGLVSFVSVFFFRRILRQRALALYPTVEAESVPGDGDDSVRVAEQEGEEHAAYAAQAGVAHMEQPYFDQWGRYSSHYGSHGTTIPRSYSGLGQSQGSAGLGGPYGLENTGGYAGYAGATISPSAITPTGNYWVVGTYPMEDGAPAFAHDDYQAHARGEYESHEPSPDNTDPIHV
eukprot:TRINITY_DN5391_c0_g1_i1.p1 TRINITY_DN5391_c0_g1~~TRINITY_DN5391_c0_g1_i1.p1  ORF type:complete len:765 (-),score=69.80 TRINITY_DN5391_c0_g1_i1:331-2625(-)